MDVWLPYFSGRWDCQRLPLITAAVQQLTMNFGLSITPENRKTMRIRWVHGSGNELEVGCKPMASSAFESVPQSTVFSNQIFPSQHMADLCSEYESPLFPSYYLCLWGQLATPYGCICPKLRHTKAGAGYFLTMKDNSMKTNNTSEDWDPLPTPLRDVILGMYSVQHFHASRRVVCWSECLWHERWTWYVGSGESLHLNTSNGLPATQVANIGIIRQEI